MTSIFAHALCTIGPSHRNIVATQIEAAIASIREAGKLGPGAMTFAILPLN
jgi:hypothetical protein